MSGAIPLALTQSAAMLAPLPPAAPLTLSMQVIGATEALSSLPQTLSITGTPVGMLEGGQFALQTSKGLVQLALLAASVQDSALLSAFITGAKTAKTPIEIVLQAGSPPKNAFLILPANELRQSAAASNASSVADTSFSGALRQTDALRTFQKGHALTVTFMPEDTGRAAFTGPSSSGGGDGAAKADGKVQQQGLAQEAKPTQAAAFLSRAAQALGLSGSAATTQAGLVKESESTTATLSSSALSANDAETPEGKRADAPQTLAQSLKAEATPRTVRLRLDALAAPHETLAAEPTADQIKATVVSRSHSGHILLQGEGKSLFVHQAGELPVGTKVLATPLPDYDYPTTPLPRPSESDFAPLRALMDALEAAAPQEAGRMAAWRVPSPLHHLAGTALFFLSALQSGTLEEWLGGTPLTARLESVGKRRMLHDLMESLQTTMDTPARDSAVGEWKAYPLPLHYGAAHEMLTLYVHRDPSRHQSGGDGGAEAGERAKTNATRFVINVTLSRLGAMQLDGLSQAKKLDLIVRSETKLPEGLATSLQADTIKTLEALGLTGSLTFQTGRQQWLVFQTPSAEMRV